jgi:3-oxoacyl-[acyl-carrier protein] reductase
MGKFLSVMIKNKNIIVTGCSRGLGFKIANTLAEQGANVYGVSRKLSEQYSKLMESRPNSVHFKAFDLADHKSVQQSLFNEYVSNAIPIHGLVNNAAVAYDDIVTNVSIENVEAMYAINVYSPFVLTKYSIRNMILNRVGGSIVNLSSISVYTGYKGLAMYASTKGALEAFSKNVSREWGERSIRSNCIVAGFMETDMSATLSDDERQRIYRRNSLKKSTDVDSVANTVAYLISDQSRSITGQNIHVDSGTI